MARGGGCGRGECREGGWLVEEGVAGEGVEREGG